MDVAGQCWLCCPSWFILVLAELWWALNITRKRWKRFFVEAFELLLERLKSHIEICYFDNIFCIWKKTCIYFFFQFCVLSCASCIIIHHCCCDFGVIQFRQPLSFQPTAQRCCPVPGPGLGGFWDKARDVTSSRQRFFRFVWSCCCCCCSPSLMGNTWSWSPP